MILITWVLIFFICPVVALADVAIGVAGPMSGSKAWSGEQFRRGAELAVADINSQGGILGQKLQLIVADDASDPAQAVAVAHKLVSDGVIFVVGHRASDASIAASPIYAKNDILQISPSSTNPLLTEQGFDTVFRVCGRDNRQGADAANYLASSWAKSRIALLHDGSIYGKGLVNQTIQSLNTMGIKVAISLQYSTTEPDYHNLLRELKDTADVIYFGGYSTEIGLITSQAAAIDYHPQIIAGDSLHNTDFWLIAGNAGEGARFTFDVDPRTRPVAKELVSRFREASYDPEGYTVHTYVAIQVWANAVKNAASFETKKVTKSLRSMHFDTALGKLEFDAKGDLKKHNYVWYEWRDGQYYLVE